MRQLNVIVASPDEALSTRTASVLANRGHRVVKRCTTSIDALEACFEEVADLAVLDDDLRTVSGSHIARVLKDLRSPVAALVMHRGSGEGLDDSLLVLDPSRDGFEAALLNIADSLTPPRPAVAGRTRLGPFRPARAT